MFNTQSSVLSTPQWLTKISHYRGKIRHWKQNNLHLPHPSALLFCQDTGDFAIRMFALGLEQVSIILPPNDQPETLAELAQHAHMFAGTSDGPSQLDCLESVPAITLNSADLCWDWPYNEHLTFFTSGSSGAAKSINKRWHHILTEVACLHTSFQPPESIAACLSTVSHQHIYGLLFKLLLPLVSQQTITQQVLYPEDLQALVQQYPSVRIICSPAFLQRLVQDNVLVEQKHKIKQIFSSGAPLPDEVAYQCFKQLGVGVTQIYGSSETGGIGFRQLTTEVTPWTPFEGMKLSCNPEQRLILSSPYIDTPRLLLDDRVTIESDGQFYLLGRSDRTIKIEDKRLDLDAMEAWLKQHPWVHDCRLVLLSGHRRQLGVVIALSALGTNAKSTMTPLAFNRLVKQHLQLHFELVCIPRKFRYLDELPYNTQGKLINATLENLFV
jgi:acyl-coenzyme A synthetase/AMP-(fatty) acid ligase